MASRLSEAESIQRMKGRSPPGLQEKFADLAEPFHLARIPKLTFAEFPLFADLADSFRSPSVVEYSCRPEARATTLWGRHPPLLPGVVSGSEE